MVASLKPREFNEDHPGHTEQLVNWIHRVRTKKIMCRRNRKRDLRVEAVLTSVLSKAELELRTKQISRIVKWQQMKDRLLEDIKCKQAEHQSGKDKDGGQKQSNNYGGTDTKEECNAWELFPELQSLDSFMSQLNEIKVSLER
ncbi:uncharacterized protein LOC131675079 [Phymastichus coffea]|uniref:uncharacterized protein LOC131675079 n=1 Tax=Phymastichus coffea TaxID=108790 RepID=UPI00273ABDF2|nr:uncharacterized protein LOC131675079 [Phymastichus coffea]